MKTYFNYKKVLSILWNLITILNSCFILWILISLVDINLHNLPTSEGYMEYQSWNFFVIWDKLVSLIN